MRQLVMRGFGVVGHSQMGYAYHAAHQLHVVFGHAVIEPSAVAQHGVYKHGDTILSLFAAVVGHKLGLFAAVHPPSADGIVAESQLFPHLEGLAYVGRGVHNGKLSVVESVGYECRGQVERRMSHIRQHRYHGSHAHLAVPRHVVDEQYLFSLHCVRVICLWLSRPCR